MKIPLFPIRPVASEDKQQAQRSKSAQDFMPIADIEKGIIYRKEGTLLGVLRVQPLNLELLSDKEKRRKVEAFADELNGEAEGFQIFCIGRPVDLNSYIDWLNETAKMEQDFTKKQILKGFIQQASDLSSSGEIVERRFYIILSKKPGVKAVEELNNRLKDFQAKLLKAELKSHICSDDELLDLLSLFSNPVQAAYERAEMVFGASTILE